MLTIITKRFILVARQSSEYGSVSFHLASKLISERYLEHCQASTTELLCEKQLKTKILTFSQKSQLSKVDSVLYRTLDYLL